MLKAALGAAWEFLRSPAARRYEAALLIGLYEAIRAAVGHA